MSASSPASSATSICCQPRRPDRAAPCAAQPGSQLAGGQTALAPRSAGLLSCQATSVFARQIARRTSFPALREPTRGSQVQPWPTSSTTTTTFSSTSSAASTGPRSSPWSSRATRLRRRYTSRDEAVSVPTVTSCRWSGPSPPTRSPRTPQRSTARASRWDGEAVLRPSSTQLFEQIKRPRPPRPRVPAGVRRRQLPDARVLHGHRAARPRRRLGAGALQLPQRHRPEPAGVLGPTRAPRSFDRATHTLTGTRFSAEIAEILRGDAWGSMDITEPDAGSDMGALKSRGEQDEHGDWFVSGQKIFITSGHGKYHFVIARTEKARRRQARPRRPVAVPRPRLRGPAGRHAQAPRHPRPRRGEARPRGLGHRRAHLRPQPGAAHRQARRGLQATCSCS
jgi:hypothetical protein